MLLRCIMTVLLLIATAMPAWANAQEQELPPEIQELIKAGVELYEEEVLQNLRIEVDDQLQGDTYTLTYTITNPTNTPLNKKAAFATVTYDACHAADPYHKVTQYTDAIPALVVAPGETATFTISLKQPMAVQFNHLNSCTVFFEDNSTIHYNTLSETAPPSPFHLTPIVSPFGDVTLQIQNYSPSQTITELSDVRWDLTIGEESHKKLLADPIALTIKPGETHSMPLFKLESANNTRSSGFSLGANTANATRNYNYRINMKINGISHTYSDNYTDATQVSGALKSTRIDRPEAYYQFASQNLIPENGAFYLDGTTLHGYLNVKSISETTFTSANAAYRLTLSYFDQKSLLQEKQYTLHLPQDFAIGPHKSKYYSFQLPLPADFKKPYAQHTVTLKPIATRNIARATLVQVASSSKVPKKDYIPLTNIETEK